MIAFGAPLHQEDRMSKKIMWASVLAGALTPLVLYWLENIADDNHPGLSGTMHALVDRYGYWADVQRKSRRGKETPRRGK
jgi:hypothetical protein